MTASLLGCPELNPTHNKVTKRGKKKNPICFFFRLQQNKGENDTKSLWAAGWKMSLKEKSGGCFTEITQGLEF